MANYYQNKKPEISKEEKKYQEAAGLLASIDCITRFEWEIKTLENAASIFEKLGEYKDAKEQAAACQKRISKAREKGYEKVFLSACEKQEKAFDKSGYADAVANFKRVLDSEKYGEQARERISACKKSMNRLAAKAVWKKRGIALLVLLLAAGLFYVSPAYPFARGYIYQKQGKYRKAVKRYEQADGFLLAEKELQKCHLAIGEKYLKKGKKKAAMEELRKAADHKQAQTLIAGLEREHLEHVHDGQKVQFGKVMWVVLKKETDHVLLLYQKQGRKMAYNTETNEGFRKSHIGRWLNRSFKGNVFSEEEKEMLEEIDAPANEEEAEDSLTFQISLLSGEEYLSYQELLKQVSYPFWLKEERRDGTSVNYVEPSGEIRETDGNQPVCHARPVVYVKL